jgi:uncharacterized C2H2 Zn-finger protein
MHTCPWCNATFRPSRDWQQFCSTQHQQAWHRHQRKLGEVRAAEALANRVKEIVDRHIARIDEAMQAQAEHEPIRRRL